MQAKFHNFPIDETLFIMDGSAYVFRCFYGIPPLSTKKENLPTNSLHGFCNVLKKLFAEYAVKHFTVTFDSGTSFRKKLHPDYKANRQEPPELLRPQFEYFPKLTQALGITTLMDEEYYEADDIIASVTKKVTEAKCGNLKYVVIMSGDKDLYQLIESTVVVWDTFKNVVYDCKKTEEKFGVAPNKIRDLLAITGDSSDNIKGINGIGPVGAKKILAHTDVPTLLNDSALIDQLLSDKIITKKVGEKIREELESLKLSYKLVTLATDYTTSCSFELELPRQDLIADLQDKLELKELTLVRPKKIPATKVHLVSENNLLQFKRFLGEAKKAGYFAVDVETTGLINATLLGIAFSSSDTNFYLPVPFTDIPEVRECLADASIIKIFHNYKFDQAFLPPVVNIFDTMLAAYLLDPDLREYSLNATAERELGYGKLPFDLNYSREEMAQYAGHDTHLTLRIYEKLLPRIKEQHLEKALALETAITPILVKMENHGINVDISLLEELSERSNGIIEEITAEIYAETGEVNLNSPKQLSELLFTKLELPSKGIKKTSHGFSTDVTTLEKLKTYSVPRLLIEYRSIQKLKSTYIEPFLKLAPTIHTSFGQTTTATGRLSSNNPNLQNIPVNDRFNFRSVFVPRDNHELVSFDYSQIELRLLAHVAEDQVLIETFQNNLDVHSATAAELFNVNLSDVTPDQRRVGKTINFGIIYGMKAHRLSRELGISYNEANSYIEKYFDRFAGVKRYFDNVVADSQESGIVRTVIGRIRILSSLPASNDVGYRDRVAMNAPIQGSAADIIKLGMVAVDGYLSSGITASSSDKMLCQIHDELLIELRKDSLDEKIDKIKNLMENCYTLIVPLKVDYEIGWVK